MGASGRSVFSHTFHSQFDRSMNQFIRFIYFMLFSWYQPCDIFRFFSCGYLCGFRCFRIPSFDSNSTIENFHGVLLLLLPYILSYVCFPSVKKGFCKHLVRYNRYAVCTVIHIAHFLEQVAPIKWMCTFSHAYHCCTCKEDGLKNVPTKCLHVHSS